MKEFKEFALKGNMLDLAIGMIMGGAFGNIVQSLVNGILMSRVKSLAAGDVEAAATPPDFPAFFGSIISFLLLSLMVFFIVKAINRMKRGQEPEPVSKNCEYCFFAIPIQATRCGHCTSELQTENLPVTV